VELPAVMPAEEGFRLDDARVTDFDVLLLRADLPPGHLRVLNQAAGNFATTLQVPVAGVPVSFPRGWCLVDLQIRGRHLRVINTHLESFVPLIRYAQALELVTGPASAAGPTVCLGDFNSDPTFPPPEAYGVMAAAGYTDAWATTHPGDPGYTWGQAEDLLNPVSTVSERDDHIWYRGEALAVQAVELLGGDPADRVPSLVNPQNLLWPSDHLGVAGWFRVR
jgi:endonuclease/exonuclease/phosphatase family metal-dependent hydrolase